MQHCGAALDTQTAAAAATFGAAEGGGARQRLLYGLLTVVLPWAWARAGRWTAASEHPERLRWWRRMQRIETAVAALTLLNSLHFLYDGRFPTVPMALLRLQLVYTKPHEPYQADFTFMDQQAAT